MPSALRAQVALIALFGVLLIPIGTSSLRGLTHILTCQEAAAAPFTIQVPDQGPPLIQSSQVLERNPDGSVPDRSVCGGLILDVFMGSEREDRADVTLSITNESEFGWRGSVQLQLDAVDIPIDIGEIRSGETASDSFELRLDEGSSYEIKGDLLIGP
ncbi:MAG: hypothetical protein ACJ739_04880 [Acidimicrobiales bacterium]